MTERYSPEDLNFEHKVTHVAETWALLRMVQS